MSMRIDGQQPPVDGEAARRLEAARTAAERAAERAPTRTASGDRVEVSTDAQLVSAAVQAANDAPAVRPEAVERGRRALESGTLGADADRLAHRIVDALLGE